MPALFRLNLAFALVLAGAPALAQQAGATKETPAFPSLNDRGICPGVQVFGENIPVRLMKVTSSQPRVHFVEDRMDKAKEKAGCPSEAEACKRKGFLVSGDEVLAGWTNGAYACVSYISPKAKRVKGQFAETTGYIRLSDLAPVALPVPRLAEWQGNWSRSAEADIEITAAPEGALKVAGQASYGSADAGRVARGAVNVGELEGQGKPTGDALAVGEDYTDPAKPLGDDRSECRARLRLFGRYLMVEDNVGCGGANVSFTGIYVKLAR